MLTERLRGGEFPSRTDFLFAVLAGGTGVAGSYAVAGYTRRFVVAPIDAAVVRLTPGEIVAFVIQNVGEQGHLLHVGLSLVVATGLLAATALGGRYAARRVGRPVVGGGLACVLAWGLTVSITAEPVLAVGAAGPVAAFTTAGAVPLAASGRDPSRRRVLVASASALTFLGISIGLGRSTAPGKPATGETGEIDEEVSTLLQEAEAKSLDIRGDVPGLVSTFDEFYNVDIATFDPTLSPEDWSLTITGEVDDDVTVSFDELTDMPTERRFVTLRCVGETLNGRKLDNAVWTGTPIKPLLEEADPGGECGCAMVHAADDYFVQFPIEALEDGFLAWEMNGRPLPRSHGHPVRVLIPGHWGETNVKWLTEIELLDEEIDGYWEQRGWHGTGPVNTVAKLWSDATLDDGNVEVAGHAYAGTRGIESVEVSIDAGETWRDAELSDPLPGDDVWRQWRYEFEADGTHDVVVRAIDGEGTLQPEAPSEAFPSGATGWVSKTVGERPPN
ncbi:molybdopterin-dependent oxidoreductase [Salinilacihabitans rarus]|uniref:molybdopterin-dependent oxidoreductase n=1 Tax=Salinilacihabitans rarus TaxID=2961596 RepID=UPI0020C91B5B|nr:molybdopterin-dependent oxidoreductase [Salinilacihabitans rarus]